PMGVPLPPAIPRDAARSRLGLPADAPVLASFGHVNPYKRIEPVLRAIRQLRASHPGLRYVLVGSVSPNYDLRALVQRHGLEDVVSLTGYLERNQFEDYVAAADICLNLRHPTAGESSASLLRLLGAGRPTLVTASGSFAELPPDVAAQVDPDASEGDLIVAYCTLLLNNPEIAGTLGGQARDFVAREHTLEQAAIGYIRFLSKCYGWGEQPSALSPQPSALSPKPFFGPQPSALSPQPFFGPQPSALSLVALSQAAQPTNNNQQANPALAAAAEALASLGATEDDTALLASTAQAIKQLEG
ncbi:MAG: glycosyltransferase, partial [Roseiflexaceae bacterium]|nr:glycosyltransferase [Roseiflexaceae bacterium]